MCFTDCIITYQKSNGEIFIRPYSHSIGKEKGNETAMGWKIIEIHYKYDNNYYCYDDFIKIFKKGFERELRTPKKSRKKRLISLLKRKLEEIDMRTEI